MYDATVRAMVDKAVELGVNGAGGVLSLHVSQILQGTFSPELFVVGDFTRGPKDGDDGASFLAVALTKMAEMLDTLRDSGTTRGGKPLKGELDYRGGIARDLKEGNYVFLFFSGGTADEDVEISEAGFKAFMEAGSNNRSKVVVLTIYVGRGANPEG